MSSFAYIPPPFPFPEAWSQLFQTQQTKWLTPAFALPPLSIHTANAVNVNGTAPVPIYDDSRPHLDLAAFASMHPSDEHVHSSDSEELGSGSDSDGGEEDGGEYVYGYVLSDEWRSRFRSSVQARQRLQQQQRSQREQQARQKQANVSSSNPSKSAHAKGKRRRHDLLGALSSSSGAGRTNQRTMDLQREFAAAKQREAAQRRPVAAPPSSPSSPTAAEGRGKGDETGLERLRQLESQLNLRFDEFCDAYQPVVWPHDAVYA